MATVSERAERPGAQEPEQAPQVGRRVEVLGAHGDQVGAPDDRPGAGRPAANRRAALEVAQQPLPAERHDRPRRDRRPAVRQLVGDRRQVPGGGGPPGGRERGDGDRPARVDAVEGPSRGRLLEAEDGAARQAHRAEVGAGLAEELQLGGLGGRAVDAEQHADAHAQPGQDQRAVGGAAAEPPAAGVALVDVPRSGPDHHDGRRGLVPRGQPRLGRLGVRRRGRRGAGGAARGQAGQGTRRGAGRGAPGRRGPGRRSVYWLRGVRSEGVQVHYYELHEGDDELYSDVLLAHEDEILPEDFFDLVQAVRGQVLAEFEEDTLIEAIAVELERSHGFVYISDERLTAAVNVSAEDDDNFLIATTDDELEILGSSADYRGVFVDYAGEGDQSLKN